jgi:hypothetical protein
MLTWIVTPFSNIYGPLQGAARLYAFIKYMGHRIKYKDFNQNTFFSLLSKNYLEICIEKLSSTLHTLLRTNYLQSHYNNLLLTSSNYFLPELLQKGSIEFTHHDRFYISKYLKNQSLVFDIIANNGAIINTITTSSNILNTFFFNLKSDVFLNNFAAILCGKALYDAAYFPALLDFGFGFFGIKYGLNIQDIYNATYDEKSNYLIAYFNKDVLPLVYKEQPQIIGLSITHASDMIPAFTLCRLIKSHFSEIHICIGGAAITELSYRLKKNHLLWNFFDSLIIGPGEESFSCLIDHIQNRKNLNKVPNLIYKLRDDIKENSLKHEFNLNKALCPEFPSLRPRNPVMLETASGCYWGKCIFCYYPHIGRNSNNSSVPKTRDIDLVCKDIAELKKTYNPLYIGFTDSSLHPERLSNILEYNTIHKLHLKFSAFIRFENQFLSKQFCSQIAAQGFLGGQIGLESGSQRINDIIHKGVIVKNAETILKNFYEAGILIHLYTIIGIPGETKNDAEKTFSFIKKLRRYILLGWQIYPFTLMEKGPLAHQTKKFQITMHPIPDNILAQFASYSISQGLSMNESLKLTIEFIGKLKKYFNPLSSIIDVESYKQILFAQKAKDTIIK